MASEDVKGNDARYRTAILVARDGDRRGEDLVAQRDLAQRALAVDATLRRDLAADPARLGFDTAAPEASPRPAARARRPG